MAASSKIEMPLETRVPRRFARQRFEDLIYLHLGADNGGFPINIGEDGMAFQGVLPLEKNQTICISFKFYGIDESVTAAAKVVWLTESRKGGGLQFIDLPAASRCVISNWISLQKRGSAPRESATATISHREAAEAPSAPAAPLLANHGCYSSQASTSVAAPLPNCLGPAEKEAEAVTPSVNPQAEAGVKKNVQIQHSDSSADLPASPRIPTPLTGTKKRLAWTRAYAAGLSASIAMVTISGMVLWPLRSAPFHRLVTENPVRTDVPSTLALKTARPPGRTSVSEPSSDPKMFESPKLAPIANPRENMTIATPRNVAMRSSSRPAQNPKLLVPHVKRGTNSRVPVFAANGIRPPSPAVGPAQREQPVSAPPSLISENSMELPVAATAAARIPSPPVEMPAIPVSAAGSIEIISDPYPSIRMPAEWKGQSSRPGTSLKIGHLVSKAEPAYPPDALRQRIAGTAKIHVIIGRNGTVERAEIVDGPGLLSQAALRAVQQWRYEPTILGGAAIEVEEDITVVFRITSPLSPIK